MPDKLEVELVENSKSFSKELIIQMDRISEMEYCNISCSQPYFKINSISKKLHKNASLRFVNEKDSLKQFKNKN